MTPATTEACAGAGRARFHRAVAAHFTGRISVVEERALREHLQGCGDCRRFYARAHVLSSVDHAAPSARERLARGLGFRAPRRSASVLRRLAWAVPALALVAWLVPRAPAPPAPRGLATAGTPAALLAYRIEANGPPRALAGDAWRINGRDELAFAYSNPGGWPYLMIFAVDEHARVYWYQPTWRPNTPPPASVAARVGAGPFELPAATRHDFDGRRVILHALFARRSLGVEEIERAARESRGPDRLTLPDDVLVVRRTIEVAP